MDEYLALFPYTAAAARYVEASGRTFDSLLTAGEFSDSVLNKSVQRVARAIDSDVHSKPVERDDDEIELFSYVMGRALVSCIREALLVQRYANAEAHDAFIKLRNAGEQLQDEYIARMLGDFGMPVPADNNIFELHFTDLIKYTGRLRGPQWRLVNLMNRGQVRLAKNEMIQVLAEAVRLKVLRGLPLKLSSKMCEELASYTSPLKKAISVAASRPADSGPVILEACPPCIKALLSQVKAGQNLSHPARFALTSFLANIGMKAEEIVNIYQTSPDFDYELTRYQVDHIKGASGKDYIPPGCSTMETYGNCTETAGLCKRVSHPLSYYRARLKPQ
ncbi:MAG TPA: DNA primase large subunit PriL [Candidatus Bathyarchaeia archaeon]|nr:DNA primase large subunit PriL [Candidatus Bathyarchaeia archaeon]